MDFSSDLHLVLKRTESKQRDTRIVASHAKWYLYLGNMSSNQAKAQFSRLGSSVRRLDQGITSLRAKLQDAKDLSSLAKAARDRNTMKPPL